MVSNPNLVRLLGSQPRCLGCGCYSSSHDDESHHHHHHSSLLLLFVVVVVFLLFLDDDDDDDDLLNISNKAGVYDRLPGPPESTGRGGEVDEYLSLLLVSSVVVFGEGAGEEAIFFVRCLNLLCMMVWYSFHRQRRKVFNF